LEPKISVVVTALNEGVNLRGTVENLESTLPVRGEIVVVDDGSLDGSTQFLKRKRRRTKLLRAKNLGVARARNWGASESTGNVIVFADAHVALPSKWWDPMIDLLAKPSIGAVSPAICDMKDPECRGYGLKLAGPYPNQEWLLRRTKTPQAVPLLPGCCWAMRRDVFNRTGGFDSGMVRWGSNDVEYSLRLWLLGYELQVVPDVEVLHLFREGYPYHVRSEWVLYNKMRLAFVHFGSRRIARVVSALQDYRGFPNAVARIIQSDVWIRRAALAGLRVRDAEWFFAKFGPRW